MPIKTNNRTMSGSMTDIQWVCEINKFPKSVIKSNSKLKKTGFFQWSIPAYKAAIVRNGEIKVMKTCPDAGVCADFCYACQGGYVFRAAKISHTRNLQAYFNDPTGLALAITEEIRSKKKLKAFRVHDSGDFFNVSYARWWFQIMKNLPDVRFYCYTKMVSMFKTTLKDEIPENLTIVYSYGGKQDHLIDPKRDRHSKVFRSHTEMIKAGYSDTTENDLHAADPTKRKIGLVYHGVMSVDNAMKAA